MKKQLFPVEITELSAEKLIKTHSRRSHIIYWVLLLSFLAIVISLFFISIDINVQSRGIITTNQRSTPLTIPTYGHIKFLHITENKRVIKGDTLLVLDTIEINNSVCLTNEKIEQSTSFIHDLEILTKSSVEKPQLNLSTPKYRQDNYKYLSELRFQKSEVNILKKEYNRDKKLYKENVISTAEYEQAAYLYKSASLKLENIQSAQLSVWQSDLENNKLQQINLNQNLIDLYRELQKHFLIAPFTGYIQNLSGLEHGSIVFSGQEIATLIPDAALIGETYISASDIGMIYEGQPIRLRIDAYEANTWGFIEGTVKEIANDITIVNGQAAGFRLICTLHSDSLQFQHKIVKIKKGMSFTANFMLTERTLAQLLYDKVSDWINPSIIRKDDF